MAITKIYIVRTIAGELESSDLAGLKVIYAFEEKSMAESYCNRLCANGRTHKVEAIAETEFREYVLPRLRSAAVSAIIFNLLPGSTPTLDSFSIDIAQPANPRTLN